MTSKKCPYCNKSITYTKGRQFASHCGNCKQRPGYQDKIDKQRKTTLQKRKDYDFNCKKCQGEYSLNLTPSQFNKGRYRACCSRKCSNSRRHTQITKLNISKSLTRYTPEEKKKRIKEQRLNFDLKSRKKRRQIKYSLLGDICFICGRGEYSLIGHRKDGEKHKRFEIINIKELTLEMESGKYVHLCYRCHKGVHFCMDILQLSWGDIISKLRTIKS